MQGFAARVNPLLNPPSRRGLKQPVNGGRCVEDNHRRSPVMVAVLWLRSSSAFFLHQAGSIQLDGNGLALYQNARGWGTHARPHTRKKQTQLLRALEHLNIDNDSLRL
jgi:hypothetical protein